mgnify:CR=1 FL=1
MDSKDIEVKDLQLVLAHDKILKEPLVSNIIALVRKHTGHAIDELRVRSRKRHLVVARQLNMFFLKRHTTYSLEVIGSLFDRNHATVIHAEKTINDLIDTDKRINNLFMVIEDEVDTYKNKDKTTRYSVFQELVNNSITDESKKKEWIEKFINAI